MSTSPHIEPPEAPSVSALKRFLLEQEMRGEKIVQAKLAREVGIDPGDLSRIVNGRLIPTKDQAQRIARGLRRTCSELGWPHHEHEDQEQASTTSAAA